MISKYDCMKMERDVCRATLSVVTLIYGTNLLGVLKFEPVTKFASGMTSSVYIIAD